MPLVEAVLLFKQNFNDKRLIRSFLQIRNIWDYLKILRTSPCGVMCWTLLWYRYRSSFCGYRIGSSGQHFDADYRNSYRWDRF